MAPEAGNCRMAARTVGKQLECRNQTTVEAASRATMNCASRSRLKPARANAATPRGVNGSENVEAFIQPQIDTDETRIQRIVFRISLTPICLASVARQINPSFPAVQAEFDP